MRRSKKRMYIFILLIGLYMLFQFPLTSRRLETEMTMTSARGEVGLQTIQNMHHETAAGQFFKASADPCLCPNKEMSFENMCFKQSKKAGTKFDCKWVNILDKFQLTEHHKAYDNSDNGFTNYKSLIFATAASSNHFNESLLMLETVQQYHAGSTILYYDIGLTMEAIDNCGIFEGFAWRNNIIAHQASYINIQEVLKDHPLVFWADASSRFLNTELKNLVTQMDRGAQPAMKIIVGGSNTIFSMTNPGVYKYLPVKLESLHTIGERGANLMIFKKSKFTKTILKWAVLCALQTDCLHPKGASLFWHNFAELNWRGRHRYDQSVFNILLLHALNYDKHKFQLRPRQFVEKHEESERERRLGRPKICRN